MPKGRGDQVYFLGIPKISNGIRILLFISSGNK
jgi:hypothetical protein